MEIGTSMNKLWDKIGICASGLCLIHCLATPIILLFFPLFLHNETHEFLHEVLAFVVIASVMVAVFPKCHKHGHYDIIAIASVGMLLVLAGLFVHDISIYLATGVTSVGSGFLIYAHYKNMRIRHGKCESEPTPCGKH